MFPSFVKEHFCCSKASKEFVDDHSLCLCEYISGVGSEHCRFAKESMSGICREHSNRFQKILSCVRGGARPVFAKEHSHCSKKGISDMWKRICSVSPLPKIFFGVCGRSFSVYDPFGIG